MQVHARADGRRLPAVLDVGRDRRVAELGDEVRLPVMPHALRHEAVEGALQRRERHHADLLGLDRGGLAQRLERARGLLVWAVPAGDQHAEEIADPVGRDEGQRRGDLPAEEAAEPLGRIRDEFAVALQDRRGGQPLRLRGDVLG